MKRKNLAALTMVLGLGLGMLGCRDKPKNPAITEMPPVLKEAVQEEVKPVTEEKEEPKSEITEFPLAENEAYSRLTGLPILKEKLNRRPIAVMTNNFKQAMPQSGLSQASVIYEAPVEGYITRFMVVFDDWDEVPAMGSIRSARTYFVRFAKEFDAFLIHAGQAYNARPMLNSDNSITDLAGGTLFKAPGKKAPHHIFTSGEKINRFFEKHTKLRNTLSEDFTRTSMFLFHEKDEDLKDAANVKSAGQVDLSGVYPINKPRFEYDSEKKCYKRHQFGMSTVDANNNELLTVKNILIQFTSGRVFDKKGRWDINETGGGEGYYFTNGRMVELKWAFKNGRTRYYDSLNGEELKINKGKTWVCIAINDKKAKLKVTE